MSEAQEPQATPKRSCVRVLFRLCLYATAILALLAVGTGLAGYLVYDYVTQPGNPGELMRVSVPEGVAGYHV
ncbi:MAG: hypothetical protein GY851_13635, partial [bacterium]|nr:hypothetical protein [bacterium]